MTVPLILPSVESSRYPRYFSGSADLKGPSRSATSLRSAMNLSSALFRSRSDGVRRIAARVDGVDHLAF
jgi:hypothetical protein